MWNAHQQPNSKLTSGRDEAASRFLLEHVVDDLNAGHLRARPHGLPTMLCAGNGRSKGRAVRSDFALIAKPLQLSEQVIPKNRLHAWVVQLVDVDVIRLQPLQALLNGKPEELGRVILCPLSMTRTVGAIVVPVVSEL